jgi:hypothetical protein
MVGKRSNLSLRGLHRICKNEARGGFLFVLLLDFQELRAGLCELAAEAVAVEAKVRHRAHQDVAGLDQSDGVWDFFASAGEA